MEEFVKSSRIIRSSANAHLVSPETSARLNCRKSQAPAPTSRAKMAATAGSTQTTSGASVPPGMSGRYAKYRPCRQTNLGAV